MRQQRRRLGGRRQEAEGLSWPQGEAEGLGPIAAGHHRDAGAAARPQERRQLGQRLRVLGADDLEQRQHQIAAGGERSREDGLINNITYSNLLYYAMR